MIRLATEADIPAILDIYGPYVQTTAISFEYTVPTLEVFTQRFRNITAQFPWLVWEENGEVLGYAYGSAPFERAAFGWCSEASIYLRPDARGRGIGKALYAVLEALMRLQGYVKVYVLVTSANQPSVDFHLACGYRHTACLPGCGFKFGNWYDLFWMEKMLNSVEMPTNPPIPFPAIVEIDRKFHEILEDLSLS